MTSGAWHGAGKGGRETGNRPADQGGPDGLPGPPLFKTRCTAIATVRSVKFCVRTAHTTVTEKYDGRAAHTALGRFWEAA
ncbi:hypothetical protein GCM10023220_59100 [Streptomyces ziwulingensis]|uniref:Transposase n=1 Tax=Streptomyces ziwulingensis TaxID=1045501 RepID=A0ABP9CWH4_9ACTN